LNRLGDSSGLVKIEGIRLTRINLAEVASPGALFTANEESGFTVFPAFINVWTARFLANGM
jgi:hypothetical protein